MQNYLHRKSKNRSINWNHEWHCACTNTRCILITGVQFAACKQHMIITYLIQFLLLSEGITPMHLQAFCRFSLPFSLLDQANTHNHTTGWYDVLHLCVAFSSYSSCPHCSGVPLFNRQKEKQKHNVKATININIVLLWDCGIFSIAHYCFAKSMMYSYDILWQKCRWLNR